MQPQGYLPNHMMNPGIILLKEGTDTSQGKAQCISNINSVQALVDLVKTTLGPRGMDTLIYVGQKGTKQQVHVTNDGATLLKLLDVVHPAARTLVEVAHSQDIQIGDGTTSVTLLAGSLLQQAKQFIEDNVHPHLIIKAYRIASQLAIDVVEDVAISVQDDAERMRELLIKCAKTAMNSKLIASHSDALASLCVDAIERIEGGDLDKIGVKMIPGGSLEDIELIDGCAFERTFSYAGFEQQPKHFANPSIACLNVELELKEESNEAEIRVNSMEEYQKVVEAEWQVIYDKLDKIRASGANIVLSQKPIGDLATQYFADHDIFCAGRVNADDMRRICIATGCKLQSSVNELNDSVLGTCEDFHEKQIGSKRVEILRGCPGGALTFILRGGASAFIAEVERSMHDAICVVKHTYNNTTVVAGGGAIEMEIAKRLRAHALTIKGKNQLLISAFARAFEVIPRQLCENAGFNPTDVLNKLREQHFSGEHWCGVDINNGGVCNTFEANVWEPANSKKHAIAAATEAASLILSVDETVQNPSSNQNIDPNEAKQRAAAARAAAASGPAPKVYKGNR
ncbi:hypothetical protein PCE1_001920 [Barthelona sp. PCE]